MIASDEPADNDIPLTTPTNDGINFTNSHTDIPTISVSPSRATPNDNEEVDDGVVDDDDTTSTKKKEIPPHQQHPQQSKDYYEYELFGILVHSGGADGGHYYSFIKERITKPGTEPRWIEFNDKLVRYFDHKVSYYYCYCPSIYQINY